ncbi:FHIPEP family type III secretion protein [Myxococcota bacterium]|nr:FHIPEP family type III secretion protein [Myxococcota bacterium]MBU1898931.1 FHIPEP family type III secretion protein [Myxococcota bacterium]
MAARSEIPIGLGVIGALALILFPAPAPLLDTLLALQFGASALLLFVALRARAPLDLGTFPTLLLLSTLLRLALNISTTRLILSEGRGTTLVQAFGDVVVGGELVVGGVIFGLLITVQYLVIAKGAERVAQVAARFALDGLPGQQQAIDAEVRGGLIDAEAARSHREGLAEETHLYGALDGAMKFVKGDAIAGLVIVGINALGGLALGALRDGLATGDALDLYTRLTIGDGLLAQLPATLTATAAAALVTRARTPGGEELGVALGRQLILDGQPLALTSLALMALALLPGLPAPPLLFAALLAALAASQGRPRASRALGLFDQAARPAVGLSLLPEAVAALAPRTPREIIEEARVRLLAEGLRLEEVAVTVTVEAEAAYQIEIYGGGVARGVLPVGHRFRVDSAKPGLSAPHPAGGPPGAWVKSTRGLSPADYLVERLCALWRQAPTSLSLQDLSDRLQRLARLQPALTRAVTPKLLDLTRLAQLLQALVSEGISIADLKGILELLARQAPDLSLDARLAALRVALAGQLTRGSDRPLPLLTLSADLVEALRRGEIIEADELAELLETLDALWRVEARLVLLTPCAVRGAARRLFHARPALPVLCHAEILKGQAVEILGLLGDDL